MRFAALAILALGPLTSFASIPRSYDPTPFITSEIPEPHGQFEYECKMMIVIDERKG